MTNFQVYKKTLPFSFLQFLVDMLALAVVLGASTIGFFIMNSADLALVGLLVGLIVGALITIPINIFLANRVKAAQISMMTKGVTVGELPEHTVKAGFDSLKGRFGRITGFYFITRAIKAIFNQLARTINKIGTAVGGDVGNGVTSAINSAIEIVIGYLCDCCMGWILFREDVSMARAGCEGAAIFFKNGKTLIRNIGRIFGIGFLSLVVIGGAFFGVFFLIFNQFPTMFVTFRDEIVKAITSADGTVPEFLENPLTLMIIVAAIGGLIMFGILHSVFIRPFILVGVLRNFMAVGQKELPTEADFAEIAKKSPKFAKLHAEM